MERRSWPWKRKSSDKTISDKAIGVSDSAGNSLSSVASLGDQENYKKVNYVQITMDTYTHLNGLEDQVNELKNQVKLSEDEMKDLKEQLELSDDDIMNLREKIELSEDEVKDLKEKLFAAQLEINNKDILIKQHAKVAEEAVSGWETADAEALALKRQLESVTLLKLTAEDKASHLDGALKECMRQIRNVREESEQKLHEVMLTKTRLEAKIEEFDLKLLQADAENASLLKSLQARSDVIVKINEEKSQCQAENEYLKENIQSYEQEIKSLKYELHVVSKELDIQNEEKKMSIRSAEVANKQHLEGVKHIAKLEAECQRLRSLVRKKLPGPAALAQMKLEVENLGREGVESRTQKTKVKNPNPHLSPRAEISSEDLQQCHKEIEFLTTRLLAMEEETKILKEALAARNCELQDSRNMFAKTVGKLKSLEFQMPALNQQGSSPKSNFGISTEVSLDRCLSNPPSSTSLSEEVFDEEGSSAESWPPIISDFSQSRRCKSIDNSNRPEKVNNLGLMDDFLEMERLASLSNGNGTVTVSSNSDYARTFAAKDKASVEATKFGEFPNGPTASLNPPAKLNSFSENSPATECEPDTERLPLLKLQSRISMILTSQTKDINMERILEEIQRSIQEVQSSIPQHPVSHLSVGANSTEASSDDRISSQSTGETLENKNPLAEDCKTFRDVEGTAEQYLASAGSQIHDFVLLLGREAIRVQDSSADGQGLTKSLEDFSISYNNLILNKESLIDFVLKLSHVLENFNGVNFHVLGFNGNNGDASGSDYVDKVTLLENKVFQGDLSNQACIDGCCETPHPCSDPEVLQVNSVSPSLKPDISSCKFTLRELQELKLEKEKLVVELAQCAQDLWNTKSQLQEMELRLGDLKSQLDSSQKQHSLVETQLTCMTESYKLLEMRAQGLESEINLLQEKKARLENDLLEQKHNHQDALARCKDLQDQMQRSEKCPMCSASAAGESDVTTKQEKEIAAAAEKLAECQETIYFLGRQLQSLHSRKEMTTSQHSE